MSAYIQIGYRADEGGEISVVAEMNVESATELETSYAQQGMIYAHRLLDTNLDDLNIPENIGMTSRVTIESGLNSGSGDDDEDEDYFGATEPPMAQKSSSEDGEKAIGVTFNVSSNVTELGCMNQVHNVVGKALYDMLAEAIQSVKI